MNRETVNAINNRIAYDIDIENYGMMSSYKLNARDMMLLRSENISFSDNEVLKNGQAIYKIERKYAAKKINGMYKQLKPKLIKII